MTAPAWSPPLDLITTAVLTLFRGDAEERKARWVYDGAYAGDPVKPVYPHHIAYAIPGGNADPFPSLDDLQREATLAFQLSTVSNLRNQCQHAARQARDRWLARTPTGARLHPLVMPAGWREIDRRTDPAMPGVDRTGDHPNAIFTCPARYLLTVAPEETP